MNDCGTYMCQINTDPMRSQVHITWQPCQDLWRNARTLNRNLWGNISLFIINKLCGLSSRETYTDRATAACRRSQC
jgi:hypothetical protein